MIVIVGAIVLLAAVVVGLVGILGNAGSAHSLTENFAVFGYHVTGSTGTLFLFGIVVGAVAMLGMSALLAGARRAASRGQDARRELAQSRRETAFLNRDLAILHEHQSASTTRAEPRGVPAAGDRDRDFRPWSRIRRPVASARRGASR
ncbi:hypothetical protein [Mycobacterium deserti]|uniref:Lipopolysaccharide assembly protein A domain-containing protein n=1 Tax=Mycobacterium deserti TaxID=2978347 RepID=A0ABT2MFN2_9MYCO|nr:hypothetical protein [Mycobacterium deserti]MCT7661093.1 hypothetical protein [Mycobacterium deserti]